MIRMALIPAAVLLALALLIHPVFAQPPLQPVAVCYAISTNGQVETTYVNVPASGAYPVSSSGSTEAIDGGFIVRHEVRYEYRIRRVYVPVVTR